MSWASGARRYTQHRARLEEIAKRQGAGCVAISARIEEEVAQLPESERAEFLEHLGLDEPGLNRLIRAGYLLKPQRDDIGTSVPRPIKDRLDRIVGNKVHCPETPWWAFWR